MRRAAELRAATSDVIVCVVLAAAGAIVPTLAARWARPALIEFGPNDVGYTSGFRQDWERDVLTRFRWTGPHSTVTLPLVAPSLAAGAALSWARALGEFGATITFAGNLPGSTQTLPTAVYAGLQTRPQGAVALSLVLLAVSLAVLVALRGRWLGAG